MDKILGLKFEEALKALRAGKIVHLPPKLTNRTGIALKIYDGTLVHVEPTWSGHVDMGEVDSLDVELIMADYWEIVG